MPVYQLCAPHSVLFWVWPLCAPLFFTRTTTVIFKVSQLSPCLKEAAQDKLLYLSLSHNTTYPTDWLRGPGISVFMSFCLSEMYTLCLASGWVISQSQLGHDELCNVYREQSAEVGASNISCVPVTVTVEEGNVEGDLSVRPSSLFWDPGYLIDSIHLELLDLSTLSIPLKSVVTRCKTMHYSCLFFITK